MNDKILEELSKLEENKESILLYGGDSYLIYDAKIVDTFIERLRSLMNSDGENQVSSSENGES